MVFDDGLLLSAEDSMGMPVFPGSESGLMIFLTSNIHYPPASSDKGIQKIVYVTFVISREGKVGNVKILKGFNDELNQEAMRVVSIMPQWFPGMQWGRFVEVQYNLPIIFSVR